MKVLADARRKLKISWGEPNNQVFGDLILNFQSSYIDTQTFLDYVDCVKHLWDDEGIQEAYRRRNEFQLVRKVSCFWIVVFSFRRIELTNMLVLFVVACLLKQQQISSIFQCLVIHTGSRILGIRLPTWSGCYLINVCRPTIRGGLQPCNYYSIGIIVFYHTGSLFII